MTVSTAVTRINNVTGYVAPPEESIDGLRTLSIPVESGGTIYLLEDSLNHGIPCVVPNCRAAFITQESVSPSARFICRYHKRRFQVEAVRQYDPVRDHNDEKVHFQDSQFDEGIPRITNDQVDPADTFSSLRRLFDGKDQFVSSGHQIKKPRTDMERTYETPEWMYDEVKVSTFIKDHFPNIGPCAKASTNCPCMACGRMRRAEDWLKVIWTYFRSNWTEQHIEDELPWLAGKVSNIVRAIRLACVPRLKKKMGRPKKVQPVESTVDRTNDPAVAA